MERPQFIERLYGPFKLGAVAVRNLVNVTFDGCRKIEIRVFEECARIADRLKNASGGVMVRDESNFLRQVAENSANSVGIR